MEQQSGTGQHQERREHQRCQVGSRASLVNTQDVLGRFQVENLSVGGALFSGINAPPVDCDATALLHLPWHKPLTVGARVVYHQPRQWTGAGARTEAGNRQRFGIQFSHSSRESARALERALQERGLAVGHRPYLTALVYTDRARLHLDLERDLARLGVRSFATRSRDDVVRWVGPLGATLVMVDVWADPAGTVELLRLLEEHAPQASRVAVVDDSSTLIGTLAVVVACSQATLLYPFDRLALAEVIGRVPDRGDN